jgi:hypothetical protein
MVQERHSVGMARIEKYSLKTLREEFDTSREDVCKNTDLSHKGRPTRNVQ